MVEALHRARAVSAYYLTTGNIALSGVTRCLPALRGAVTRAQPFFVDMVNLVEYSAKIAGEKRVTMETAERPAKGCES